MKPFRSVLIRVLFTLVFALSLVVVSSNRAYADDPVPTDTAAPAPDPIVIDPPAPALDLPQPTDSPDDPEFE